MSLVPDLQDQDDILSPRKPWQMPRAGGPFSPQLPYPNGVTNSAPALPEHNNSLSIDATKPPTHDLGVDEGSQVLLGSVLGQKKTVDTPVQHHDPTLGEPPVTLGKSTTNPHDLAGEFEALRKSMPTRDQFKQPPLATWQKILEPIAAGATAFGESLRRGGHPELGRQQFEQGLNFPESEQNRLYSGAMDQWKDKAGAIEEQVKLGKEQAETEKLGHPDPHYMDTAEGPVGIRGTQATPITDSTTGQPIGPKVTGADKPLSPDERIRRQQDIQDRRDAAIPEQKGQPLPQNLTLREGATEKDYQDALTGVTGTGAAMATAAQRKETNQRADRAQQDREEQQGLAWVTGTDPNTGKTVAVPLSQSRTMNLVNPAKMDTAEQGKMQSARQFIPLAQRALAAADKLEKDGKMGVLASRWNDFKAGKIGNEPEFAPIRVLNGLGNTLLMNLHVGSRGGAYLMEHFEDLANAGKMNAATFKAALEEELRYAQDRGMMPEQASPAGQPGQQQQAPGQEEPEYDINGNPVKH